jgi:hypothetical protein
MEGRKGQNYEQDCVEGVYVETDSTKKETNGSKEKAKLTNKTPQTNCSPSSRDC